MTLLRILKVLLMLSISACVAAIENPEAPDFLTAFVEREVEYVQAIEQAEGYGVLPNAEAAGDYYRFLDGELNAVYQHLMSVLPESSKPQLKQSQVKWIAFRDAEFAYIDETWTRERVGTSAVSTAGAHRAAVVRARVVQLMAQSRGFKSGSSKQQ